MIFSVVKKNFLSMQPLSAVQEYLLNGESSACSSETLLDKSAEKWAIWISGTNRRRHEWEEYARTVTVAKCAIACALTERAE
jgi:hypothetical protein